MELSPTLMKDTESEEGSGLASPAPLPPVSVSLRGDGYDNLDLEFLLVKAAEDGEAERVQWLLNEGADINAYPFEAADRRAIAMAENGRMIHEMFSREPDDWILPDEKGSRTALQAAAGKGHSHIVQILIAAGADINSPPSKMNGRTALQAAAEAGHVELVQILRLHGAMIDAEAGWYNGRTALQAAASSKNMIVLNHLLDAGANIDAAPGLIRGRTALQAAAESGFEDGVARLISRGANIDGKVSDYLGKTVLQAAAQYGHEQVVKQLDQAQKSAARTLNVSEPAAYYAGRTALQAAAESGNANLVQLLINRGASVDEAPAFWSGKTALEAAAQTGDWDLMQILIREGAGGSEVDRASALTAAAKGGHQRVVTGLLSMGADARAGALHAAAGGGHTEVVAALLRTRLVKTDLDVASVHGRTALEMAARGGHYQVVHQLLDAGADMNANPRNWRTPLQAAAEGGDEWTVKVLLEAGADINAPPGNFFGRTALQAAAEGGHQRVVKILLDAGAKADTAAANLNGKTALQAATEGGFLEVLQMLVNSGISLHSTDRSRRTCLHRSVEYQQLRVLDYLLTKEPPNVIDVNFQDYRGMTALHIAAEGNYATGVRRLLRAGADTDIEDNKGRTPLDIALQCESINPVSKLLIEKGADLRRYGMQFLRKVFNIGGDKLFQISEDFTGIRSVDQIAKDSVNLYFQESKLPLTKHLFSAYGLQSEIPLGEILCPPVLHARSTNEKSRSFESQAVIRWFWALLDHGEEDSFGEGIPNPRTKIMTESVKGILSCFVSFKCFIPKSDQDVTYTRISHQAESTASSFETVMQNSNISWFMWRNDSTLNPETNYAGTIPQPAKHIFRSMDFRSTLPHGWVPSHGVEFFALFILDLYDKWTHVVLRAENHLARSRQNVLLQKGGDPLLIDSLLKDAQKWDDFQELLGLHVRQAAMLADKFKNESVLYEEVKAWEADYSGDNVEANSKDAKNETGKDPKSSEVRDLQNGEGIALKHLEEKIAKLKNDIEKHILSLNYKTQELIKLQFSLVSIYEAQASTSTAMSMKRLSWITFIFLPLVFVASLFGMNVNLVANDPNWWWYAVVSGPIFALVFLGWLIFKYLPIEAWIENGVGENLQRWSKRLSKKLGHSRVGNRKRRHDPEAGSNATSEYITRAESSTVRSTVLLEPTPAYPRRKGWLGRKKAKRL